jgi:hypothetical protein
MLALGMKRIRSAEIDAEVEKKAGLSPYIL